MYIYYLTLLWSLFQQWKFYTSFYLGLITAVKVSILILIASIIWVPIGIWLGLKPKWAKFFMPVTQFVAAFPMNLIYPILVLGIIKYKLNVDIWTTPLMVLGTQWYILFNVIAGAHAIPKELILATKNLGVKKWLWWKKLALPSIFSLLCDWSNGCRRRLLETLALWRMWFHGEIQPFVLLD